jgi:hypothetical protein
MPANQHLKLTVKYRTPSLNVTKRQHWAAQYKEKNKAWDALELALQDTASGRSILMDSPEAPRICSTALDVLASYRMTRGGTSNSKQSKNKSRTSMKSEPRLL